MGKSELLKIVPNTEHDFEWYPTTSEIIDCINKDIEDHKSLHTSLSSVLDCGAGDGRVLQALKATKKYAIEKSRPLLDSMSHDIFIIGTDFQQQTLIDKKVDIVFSNPPYSEYVEWTCKIIEEANSSVVYLVIPERWANNELIKSAIKNRSATAEVIGEYDFLEGERAARAKINVVRVALYGKRFKGYRVGGCQKDPFKLWFEKNFEIDGTSGYGDQSDIIRKTDTALKNEVKNELVKGGDLVTTLSELYQKDLNKLMKTYKSLEEVDHEILLELDVKIEGVRDALEKKIKGLKFLYWKEMFDNMDKLTSRLTGKSRESLLSTLTSHTSVDFTPSNAYAIVVWAIKNANKYYDSQLCDLVESLAEQANVVLYKSNKKTFGDEQWRYCWRPEGLDRYSLDYRVILHRSGGLCLAEYSYDKGPNGLSKRAANKINDIITIAKNLNYNSPFSESASSYEWDTHVKNNFHFTPSSTGKDEILFEAKAFKNGNLHLKFDQSFIARLNVEFGRIKGWIKSPKQAAEEMGVSIEEAKKSFNSNIQIENKSLVLLLSSNTN